MSVGTTLLAPPVFSDPFRDPLACFNRFESARAATLATVLATGMACARAQRLLSDSPHLAPAALVIGGIAVPPYATTFAHLTQLNISEHVPRTSSVPVVFISGAASNAAATFDLEPFVSPKVPGAPDRLLAHAN